jgi:hypothetical protein
MKAKVSTDSRDSIQSQGILTSHSSRVFPVRLLVSILKAYCSAVWRSAALLFGSCCMPPLACTCTQLAQQLQHQAPLSHTSTHTELGT